MGFALRGRRKSTLPEETEQLGRLFGQGFATLPPAKRPSLILLFGGMGAGKTIWTRGFASGFGASEEVHSPTYTVMNVYKGKNYSLYHLDLYRLQYLEEIVDIGVFEVIEDGSPCVVEWAERVPQLADWPHVAVTIDILEEETRLIKWHKGKTVKKNKASHRELRGHRENTK